MRNAAKQQGESNESAEKLEATETKLREAEESNRALYRSNQQLKEQLDGLGAQVDQLLLKPLRQITQIRFKRNLKPLLASAMTSVQIAKTWVASSKLFVSSLLLPSRKTLGFRSF